MAKFVITVAISIEADTENEAEQCLDAALSNLMGGDLGSFETIETREVLNSEEES